jgi:integrase
MRLLLPEQNGYHTQSTRTKNEFEAGKIALQAYEKFQVRSLSGNTLRTVKFSVAVDGWAKDYKGTQSSARDSKYIEADIVRMKKYPAKFFVEHAGDVEIDTIDDALIQDFYVWRRQNTFTHGKQVIPNDGTRRKEMNLIKSLMKYAHRKKLITDIPALTPPTGIDARRPAFTATEWKKLYSAARQWVKSANTHQPVHRDRFYCQHYVLILVNSGIRVGEARELRWGNIRTLNTADGAEIVASVKGKAGERDVVMNPNTRRYLQRLYDWRTGELGKAPNAAEYLFCHKDGRQIGSLRKSFDSLIDFAGVAYNSKGEKRSIYSLCHTYATFRLEEVSVYFVAKNMGTSVAMIERFYGQTRTKEQAEALVKNAPRPAETKDSQTKSYPF